MLYVFSPPLSFYASPVQVYKFASLQSSTDALSMFNQVQSRAVQSSQEAKWQAKQSGVRRAALGEGLGSTTGAAPGPGKAKASAWLGVNGFRAQVFIYICASPSPIRYPYQQVCAASSGKTQIQIGERLVQW